MPKYILDRRRFLRRTGEALLVVTAAGRVMFTDPARSWAITMEVLDEHGAHAARHDPGAVPASRPG